MKPLEGEPQPAVVPDPNSIAKTVNVVLEYALKSRASDIHIEPRPEIIQVRYRVDGVLHEAMTLSKLVLTGLVSYIKEQAKLPLEPAGMPQEGRFTTTIADQELTLAVSTLPVVDGEKIVLRLIDEAAHPLGLEELGLEKDNLARVARALTQTQGLILVTGPIGSGKTTTLYSLLSLLKKPNKDIETIEETIEFNLTGIDQTEANASSSLTLAAGLRSILSQDPDIVMVSELRDSVTADLAVQGGSNGHLVLAGLHAKDSVGAIVRLGEMGIEPFLVASTVKLVIAQRLVRRLCPHCRLSYAPTIDEIKTIKASFNLESALGRLHGDPAKASPATATASAAPVIPSGGGRMIKPEHAIVAGQSILDRIAADPNIINRSMAEAEAKRPEPAAPIPKPTPVKPAVTVADPAHLKANEFLLYRGGPGCDECNHSGYTGRLALFELLEIDANLSKVIVAQAHADAIREAATHTGMTTLKQEALLGALRGETTLDEVIRVGHEIDS